MSSRMPLTSLTAEEFTRIEEIKVYLVDNLWDRAVIFGETLVDEQAIAITELGLQMFGTSELFLVYRSTEDDFD